MGGTRALITVRTRAGDTIYYNGQLAVCQDAAGNVGLDQDVEVRARLAAVKPYLSTLISGAKPSGSMLKKRNATQLCTLMKAAASMQALAQFPVSPTTLRSILLIKDLLWTANRLPSSKVTSSLTN